MSMFQSSSPRSSVLACRGVALAAFAGALTLGAHAQQATPFAAASAPAPLLASLSTRPMDLATLAGVDYSSSSDSLSPSDAVVDPASLTFPGTSALQPPPRRRYGRPRYNDSSHNSDGSSKYTFEAGVGLTLPTGDTYHYFNTSYGFSVGGGRQFNKHFAVLLQFDYDHFGINGATLDNQSFIYNNDPNLQLGGSVDGNNHVWSFTVDPTYTFYQGDKIGAYVVGGVGFYHKVTNFTTPEQEAVDYYGFIEQYTANAVFDHYTSNAPGYNGGFGLTYKFSRFADEKFFIEAKYVFIDNSQRSGLTPANAQLPPFGGPGAPGSSYTGNDFFPANSNRTTYIPIKIGVRF